MPNDAAKPTKQVKQILVTLGEHLQPLRDRAKSEGVSANHIIRHLVAKHLKMPKHIGGIPFGGKTLRPKTMQLKLLPEEMEALREFSVRENVASSSWLIQRLQDAMAVSAGTSVGREELRRMAVSLDEVQRTLVGMATNLNQVTRSVNSCVKQGDKLPASQLLVLKELALHLREIVKPAQEILVRLDNPRSSPFGTETPKSTPKSARKRKS